jgi:hypothetical protein
VLAGKSRRSRDSETDSSDPREGASDEERRKRHRKSKRKDSSSSSSRSRSRSRSRRRSKERHRDKTPHLDVTTKVKTENQEKFYRDIFAQLTAQQQSLIATMTEMAKKSTPAPMVIPPSNNPSPNNGAPRVQTCAFCRAPGHYVRDCDQVAEYIRQGKAKKDPTTYKLVLPTGEPIPEGERGQTLKTRLDNWLNRMKKSMILEVTSPRDTYSQPSEATVASYARTDEYHRLVAAVRAEQKQDLHPMQTRSKNVDQANEPQVNRIVPDGDTRPAHPVKPLPNSQESH